MLHCYIDTGNLIKHFWVWRTSCSSSNSIMAELIILGIVGIATFQVPFFLVLLPDIQARYRLKPTFSSLLMHEEPSKKTTSVPCDGDTTNVMTLVAQCFDPHFSNEGHCNQSYHQSIQLIGLYNYDDRIVKESQPLLQSPAPLLPAASDWCKKEAYIDSKTMIVYESKSDVFNINNWLNIFLWGGFFGLTMIPSYILMVAAVGFSSYYLGYAVVIGLGAICILMWKMCKGLWVICMDLCCKRPPPCPTIPTTSREVHLVTPRETHIAISNLPISDDAAASVMPSTNSSLECNICFETSSSFMVGTCGHSMCDKCHAHITSQNEMYACPFCKKAVSAQRLYL